MSVVIPEHPEIELTAVAKQMTVRILECNRGGFVLIFDQGMAACTSFTEALEAIENEGIRVQHWDRPEQIPDGIRPSFDPPTKAKNSLGDAMHALNAAIAAITAAAVVALSVKIA